MEKKSFAIGAVAGSGVTLFGVCLCTFFCKYVIEPLKKKQHVKKEGIEAKPVDPQEGWFVE